MDIGLEALWLGLGWKHYGYSLASTMAWFGMEALWLGMGWKHYGLVWDGSTMAWFGMETKVVAGLAWQAW